MPSSAAPWGFGHSRRTDHAVAMSAEKHSSVPPRTRAMAAATAPRCSQQSAWDLPPQLVLAGHRTSTFGRPAPDDRKLLDRFVVVEDATLSPSIKLTSWTSQLL